MTCTLCDWFRFWFCLSLVEAFKPITKRDDRNHVITFDSQLKTTLLLTNAITEPYVLREPVSCDGSFRFQLRG